MATEHDRLKAILTKQESISEDFIKRAIALQDKLFKAMVATLGCDQRSVVFAPYEAGDKTTQEQITGTDILSAKGMNFIIRLHFGPRYFNIPLCIVPTAGGLSIESGGETYAATSDDEVNEFVKREIRDLEEFMGSTGIRAAITAKVEGRELSKRTRRTTP